MPRYRFLSLLAVLALVAGACQAAPADTPAAPADTPAAPGDTPAAPADTPAAEAPGDDWPDRLVIGFVPSREAAALVETIEPIADHLSQELGIEVEGFVSTDYTGLVTAMETGQAHIGAFGPFAMLQAVDRAQAEVILQSERFGSPTYHTQFFTNNPDVYCTDDPVENERTTGANPGTFMNCNGTERGPEDSPIGPIGVEAIASTPEGTTVAFVEQTSASGYIFPATVFAVAGRHPETGLNPLFAGSHDAAVIAVCEGQAEIGVSFDDARPEATTECDVNNEVVVFAYGPEIPNDGIVVDGDLPDDLKQAIQQSLIEYSESDEGSEVLQEVYNITRLTEPNLEALQIVRDAFEQLDLD
jgi:phosphonate transport system substrate-binding protein